MTVKEQLCADLSEHFAGRLTSSLSLLTDEKKQGTRFSLPLSTFYIFDTNGTKWVMDPSLRTAGTLTDTTGSLAERMKGAEYIFITHSHDDHFERKIVRSAAGKGFKWIIPEFMAELAKDTGLSEDEIILSRPGETLMLGNLTVMPFPGRHYRSGTHKGVPCMGYRVSSPGSPTLLFPGDVRDYSTEDLPDVGKCDVVFAHVWLGDGNCMDDDFPMIRDFVRYFASFGAKKVLLTHLYESGREEDSLWRRDHAERIKGVFAGLYPEIETVIPDYGAITGL